MTMSTRESPRIKPASGGVRAGDTPGPAPADSTGEPRDDSFLVLNAVAKEFGSRAAVQSTTLSFGAGEFVTLLGPSGCGKTTLLRLIGGFEHPTRGGISFRGRDLAGGPPEGRPLNMGCQSYAPFPHPRACDNT